MDKIISPSTNQPVGKNIDPNIGYDYTIGPKHTLSLDVTLSSTIYSKSLKNKNKQVSLSSYIFLFQELVSQQLDNSKSVSEIESKLNAFGYSIGLRLIELINFRESVPNKFSSSINDEVLSINISMMKRRKLKILEIVTFIHSDIWNYLFGKQSDDLVKSSERENEYMIIDNHPKLSEFFINTSIQCESFTSGIIEGILDSAGFPCEVTAHLMPEESFNKRCIYLINFDKNVVERESLRQ